MKRMGGLSQIVSQIEDKQRTLARKRGGLKDLCDRAMSGGRKELFFLVCSFCFTCRVCTGSSKEEESTVEKLPSLTGWQE